MKKYMTIGAITGTIITAERLIRMGQCSNENMSDPAFWVGAGIGAVINAVMWPVSVVAEIYNIADGR